MKITKITTYRLPPRWMFLKIETDEGVVGWGEPVIEGRARTVEAAVHELGDYLIGQDRSHTVSTRNGCGTSCCALLCCGKCGDRLPA